MTVYSVPTQSVQRLWEGFEQNYFLLIQCTIPSVKGDRSVQLHERLQALRRVGRDCAIVFRVVKSSLILLSAHQTQDRFVEELILFLHTQEDAHFIIHIFLTWFFVFFMEACFHHRTHNSDFFLCNSEFISHNFDLFPRNSEFLSPNS